MSKHIQFENLVDNSNYSGVKDVPVNEVLKNKDNLTLIDVRRPDEYTGELGHVAGAELLTLDYLPQKISEISQEQTIVFICRSGNRSGQATQFAQENGFENVYNMLGGMIQWNEDGLPVEGK